MVNHHGFIMFSRGSKSNDIKKKNQDSFNSIHINEKRSLNSQNMYKSMILEDYHVDIKVGRLAVQIITRLLNKYIMGKMQKIKYTKTVE